MEACYLYYKCLTNLFNHTLLVERNTSNASGSGGFTEKNVFGAILL